MTTLVLCVRAVYSEDATLALLLASSVVQGVGMALIIVPMSAWGLETLAAKHHAAATGLSSFGRSMSGGAGIAVTVLFWEAGLRHAAPGAAAVAGASARIFGWSALLLLLVIPLMFVAPRARQEAS